MHREAAVLPYHLAPNRCIHLQPMASYPLSQDTDPFYEMMAAAGLEPVETRLLVDGETVMVNPFSGEDFRDEVFVATEAEGLPCADEAPLASSFRELATELLRECLEEPGIQVQRGGWLALKGSGFVGMCDSGRHWILPLDETMHAVGRLRNGGYAQYPAQPALNQRLVNEQGGWSAGTAAGLVLLLEEVAICESKPCGQIIHRPQRLVLPLALRQVRLYQACSEITLPPV